MLYHSAIRNREFRNPFVAVLTKIGHDSYQDSTKTVVLLPPVAVLTKIGHDSYLFGLSWMEEAFIRRSPH